MTKVGLLIKRLSEDHKLKVREGSFQRTRSGYWQRSSGAFSWFASLEDGTSIGSCYSVTELLAKGFTVEEETGRMMSNGLELYTIERSKSVKKILKTQRGSS
jgi:hypothetical protein